MARRTYKRDRKGRFARVGAAGRTLGRKKNYSAKRNPVLKKRAKKRGTIKAARKQAKAAKYQKRNTQLAKNAGIHSPQPARRLTRKERGAIVYGNGKKWNQKTVQQKSNTIVRNSSRAVTAVKVARAAAPLAAVAVQAYRVKSSQRAWAKQPTGVPRNALGNITGSHLKSYAKRSRKGVYTITNL